MRLLVRASTIRTPTTNPPRPRIFALGRQGTRGSAQPQATAGLEAIGRQDTAGTATYLKVRPALQGTRGRATALIRAYGSQGSNGSATANTLVGYQYARIEVAERHEDLTAATFNNYVARWFLSGTWLKSAANGGRIQSATAYDLIFELLDGTRLDHEIESYDGTAGELYVAIRFPTWATTTDQFKLRCRYGATL